MIHLFKLGANYVLRQNILFLHLVIPIIINKLSVQRHNTAPSHTWMLAVMIF